MDEYSIISSDQIMEFDSDMAAGFCVDCFRVIDKDELEYVTSEKDKVSKKRNLNAKESRNICELCWFEIQDDGNNYCDSDSVIVESVTFMCTISCMDPNGENRDMLHEKYISPASDQLTIPAIEPEYPTGINDCKSSRKSVNIYNNEETNSDWKFELGISTSNVDFAHNLSESCMQKNSSIFRANEESMDKCTKLPNTSGMTEKTHSAKPVKEEQRNNEKQILPITNSSDKQNCSAKVNESIVNSSEPQCNSNNKKGNWKKNRQTEQQKLSRPDAQSSESFSFEEINVAEIDMQQDKIEYINNWLISVEPFGYFDPFVYIDNAEDLNQFEYYENSISGEGKEKSTDSQDDNGLKKKNEISNRNIFSSFSAMFDKEPFSNPPRHKGKRKKTQNTSDKKRKRENCHLLGSNEHIKTKMLKEGQPSEPSLSEDMKMVPIIDKTKNCNSIEGTFTKTNTAYIKDSHLLEKQCIKRHYQSTRINEVRNERNNKKAKISRPLNRRFELNLSKQLFFKKTKIK